MFSDKIKEYKLSKYKKTDPLSLFSEGYMHTNQSFYVHFYSTVLLEQYLRWN